MCKGVFFINNKLNKKTTMSIQVKGTVVQILKSETGVSKAGKEWTKQEFVIETNEQYPKKVCFTLFGDKSSLLDGITEGKEVEVFFNVESHDFNGRWFHNINAWKIELAGAVNAAKSYPPEFSAGDIPAESSDDNGNDLPF